MQLPPFAEHLQEFKKKGISEILAVYPLNSSFLMIP